MFKKITRIINSIEGYPLTISKFILAFSAIITLRLLGENLMLGLEDKSAEFFIGSSLVAYLFFLFSYLLILLFLVFFLKESVKKIANVLLWGFWLTVFPPLLDRILCGASQCWSFYAFDSLAGLGRRFITFFGDNPRVGITYGVRIEVALAVLFVALYAYIKQKKVGKALLAGILTYLILFVLGSFPSWLTFVFLAFRKGILAVQGYDVAGFFLSPASFFSFAESDFLNALNRKMNLIYAFLLVPTVVFFFWKISGEKFRAVAQNIRWIQITIHAGLVAAGAALGAFYFPGNAKINIFGLVALANLILAPIFAWLASVFFNDIVDLEIDKKTNQKRPLVTGEVSIEDYRQLFWASFGLSILVALSVGVKFFLIIIAYQAIAWIYSSGPFRLKRFPGVATGLSALALALLFISGFILLADGQDIGLFPAKVFWLLIIAFTVSLPIKDLKDIEGDKKSSIWTIPVLLGETWARFAIGLGIFVSYALSVVWLNAKILFFPAMLLGAVSFWLLQNKKISPRRVHIFIFGLLFVYVVLIFLLVFYPAIRLQAF